jgi:2-aminoadipate transaminase
MEPISFTDEAPGPDLLPLEELADCAATVLERDGKTILSYGSGAGYTPLREFIAEWFGVHPYRVVLTNGWLQGFSLLMPNLVQGRTVAVEYPTYNPAQKILLQSGASLISVVMDEDGMDTADLEAQLIQYARPALIYTMPSFQNPTGWTMTTERRRHLVKLLEDQNRLQVEDILLVEDESYALTRFEGEPMPAIFDLSGKQTIFSSSFSTTIAPGLRVGWFILPEELAGSVTEAANSTYITPALLSQAVVYELIRRSGIEPHLVRLREALRARRDAMLAALERHFPDATWSRPEGGYFIWLQLPVGTDARTLLSRAVGVTAAPGTDFSVTANILRLSYSAVTPDEIDTGIERLAAAMH